MHHDGPMWGRGMHPPHAGSHPGDMAAMLTDIQRRLARIEGMLAGRGPSMGRGPGSGRPGVSPEVREMMEARMKEGREKMKAAREKWENASEEERAEMKKQWERRMKEDREKMPPGGDRLWEMERRIRRLEAENARLRKDGDNDQAD